MPRHEGTLRHRATTAALDHQEQEWWAANGDLEEAFCWAQTPLARRMLRRPYLKRARRFIGAGARMLELGCGTGWVGLELIRGSDSTLIGLDTSFSQIARARSAAAAAGLTAQASFAVVGTAEAEAATAGSSFDAVIAHAFLHHLSAQEITAVLDESRSRLRPGGALVVVEPVVAGTEPFSVSAAQGPDPSAAWIRFAQRLRHLPRWSAEHRLRRMGPLELQTRRRLESRPLPEPPFGPSPKETPFRPGELEDLLGASGFSVLESSAVMCLSHLVAEDILLAALSQPRFWNAVTVPLLGLARLADHMALRGGGQPSGLWVYRHHLCRTPL